MEMPIEILRWISCAAFSFIGVACAITHWSYILYFVLNVFKKEKEGISFSFCAPFVGPLLVLIGILSCPIEFINNKWYLFAIIEPQYLMISIGVILNFLSKEKNEALEKN